MPQPPLQPIVIWFGRVGDMILLSALLEILHRRYGGACHVIGAGAWPAQIYAAHRDVTRVTCLRRYTPFLFDRGWWRAWRALRASGDAPVYVCEYDPRKLKRLQRLLTLSGVSAARCLYLTRTPCLSQATHWVDRLVCFGRLTPAAFNPADYPWVEAPSNSDGSPPPAPGIAPTKGVEAPSNPDGGPPGAAATAATKGSAPPPHCAPRLEVSAAARAECAQWLEAQGWSGRPLVLVQPGNRRTMRGRKLRLSAEDDKAWPIERWAALLQKVHAHMPQALILLCGAPRESLLLSWIRAAAPLPAVAAAELPLPRLLALCARAHSMISVDTGPAHAAAALSLPLVVMFGAHSQAQWLPRSPDGSAVIGVGGPPHSTRLDQIPADSVFAAWCALPGSKRALTPEAASATAP